ncbi:hypothetical protein [Pedobacter nyackensis]|uniref:hypothetical protein n=1 Tax=Pedobacter nyackensis TaxID=475255 RepID=UPI002930235C|nr:hypothetical protein [Pedobacter nyackensis]
MNSSTKLLWTKLQRKGSFLLVLLFLFISTSQLFHIHTEGHSDFEYGAKKQIQHINKCAICDYYHHVQGQQILLFYPTALKIASPEVITLNTLVITRNYEFSLQVIANKGPPILVKHV